MANRPHPRHAHNDSHAGPWTTCDRCGFIWSHSDMGFQYDFFGGPVEQNTGFLVCPNCKDEPAWQYKLLVLPPDPIPFANTRAEPYFVDETNFRIDETGAYRLDEDGANRISQETIDTPTGNPGEFD